MRAPGPVAFIVVGAALAAGALGAFALGGGFAAGCEVHLRNEGTEPAPYRVDALDGRHEGTLAAGAEETLRLCHVRGPGFPRVTAAFEGRGSASSTLDAHCADPVFVVNDTAARAESRPCA